MKLGYVRDWVNSTNQINLSIHKASTSYYCKKGENIKAGFWCNRINHELITLNYKSFNQMHKWKCSFKITHTEHTKENIQSILYNSQKRIWVSRLHFEKLHAILYIITISSFKYLSINCAHFNRLSCGILNYMATKTSKIITTQARGSNLDVKNFRIHWSDTQNSQNIIEARKNW